MGMQPGTLQRPVSLRPGVNPDQARLAEVIPRTRIPPVLGAVHIPPLHRVPVDIVQLFPHHSLAEDHLRMGAFLPKLVFPVALVRPFRESQASQQPLGFVFLQQLDKPGSREGLEAAHALVQSGGLGHEVQVVFQDHVAGLVMGFLRKLRTLDL